MFVFGQNTKRNWLIPDLPEYSPSNTNAPVDTHNKNAYTVCKQDGSAFPYFVRYRFSVSIPFAEDYMDIM